MNGANEHYQTLARLAKMVSKANQSKFGRDYYAEELIKHICFKYSL